MVEMLVQLLRSILIALGLIRRPDLIVAIVDDHPDRASMRSGIVYVVTSGGHAKWAYFLCPSGNGEIFQLSLQPNRRPRWSVHSDFLGRATIHPSVRQLDGAYAHFWVQGGRVDWCGDSGHHPHGDTDDRAPSRS